MDDICRYAKKPISFLFRYVRGRAAAHAFILGTVAAAVICSVTTQYGVKNLVDTLGRDARESAAIWLGFAFLVVLIAADNLLWRLASWTANSTFVGVTGDLRRDLFRHLTGHAPSYFADRLPGMLTSRITATSNAVYTIENMCVWNVLPPCAATLGAIAFVASVDWMMAAGLVVVAGVVVVAMFRLAAAGRDLHHDFADKAAAVDGEMVDVIGNMPLVLSFGGIGREHRRFEATVEREMTSRRTSLRYLEKIRLLHAVITVVLTIALLGWALMLWQHGEATTGQVVLVGTLGLSILHATRDLAVALVDVTQHMARLSEALATVLVPHALRDHPEASSLVRNGAHVAFEDVSFAYPDGRPVFKKLRLTVEPGQRVGLVGRSGAGKSTLFALLQRFYDVHGGHVLIDGQEIARVTQDSLRAAIAVVPQDISLFHRTVRENIRYGRPEATGEEVWRAAVAARCVDFIQELPQGFDTVVGDRGVKLSGGQRQRIAIARAFLKDAPILLLDEATSALDVESEDAIREALGKLMRGRTVLAIAHRLSTLSTFDRIVVMQAGTIAQDGAPGKLMMNPGLYRELIEGELNRLAPRAA